MKNYKSPVFQHRHYALIAKALADLDGKLSPDALSSLAQGFLKLFADDNPRFDAPRFYAAARNAPTHGRDKR